MALIIMSIPANIDLFNRFSLAVFQKLYLNFPIPIELDVDDLVMSVTPSGANFNEKFDSLHMGGDAIDFLASEGFLTHSGVLLGGSQYMEVRLTMKCLAVLGSLPSALDRKETLISKIRAVASKGLKDAASDQVQELASQAFTFALASAPAIATMLQRA